MLESVRKAPGTPLQQYFATAVSIVTTFHLQGPSVLLGRSRVTLSRIWCYAGIREVLPGSQSRRCTQVHRRSQPLHSEARNAKNVPASTICGVLRKWPTTTGSVPWLVPISFPRSAPRRAGRTNLWYDAVLTPCRRAGRVRRFQLSTFCFSHLNFPLSPFSFSAHHRSTFLHGRHKCTATSRPAGIPFGTQ